MTFSCKKKRQYETPLYFSGEELNTTHSHMHLGVILSINLSWHDHIVNTVSRANKRVDVLCRLAHFVDRKSLTVMFNTFIRPILEYGDTLFTNCRQRLLKQFNEELQKL